MTYIKCIPSFPHSYYSWIEYMRELNNGKHTASLWLDSNNFIRGIKFENEEDALAFKLRFGV